MDNKKYEHEAMAKVERSADQSGNKFQGAEEDSKDEDLRNRIQFRGLKAKTKIDVTNIVSKDADQFEKLAVIGHFLGRKFSRKEIKDWVMKTWKVVPILNFMPKSFFVAVFEDEKSRDEIVVRNWKFGESHLFIQNWTKNFNPLKYNPLEGPTWVRLYNIPFEYWSGNCLKRIGDTLGQTIEVDTRNCESLIYARIRVITIEEIPKEIILINGNENWSQSLEIEKLAFFCMRCKRRNHNVTECRRRPSSQRKVWHEKSANRTDKREKMPEVTPLGEIQPENN